MQRHIQNHQIHWSKTERPHLADISSHFECEYKFTLFVYRNCAHIGYVMLRAVSDMISCLLLHNFGQYVPPSSQLGCSMVPQHAAGCSHNSCGTHGDNS